MTEKTNYGIYQIRNLVNDKVYNGQTNDLTKRENKWYDDLMKRNARYNQHLERSYHKYGPDNFTFNILIENLLPEQLDEYEIAMIKFTKSHDPEIGYNKTMGGEGGVPTEETRKKLSLIQKGDNHFTKKMTPEELEEWLNKQSESHSGDNNYVAKMTPEEYKEHCNNKSGENNYINKMTPKEREECLKKRSDSNSGDNNWINKLSPEEYDKVCKRRSEAMTGENHPMKDPKLAAKMSKTKIEKGVHKGENNSNVILTERQVRSIKLLLRNLTHIGAITEIAAIYGVKPDTISAIKNGRSWTHVKVRGCDY